MQNQDKDIRPRENIGLWYQKLVKDRTMGGRVFIPLDSSEWPESWKKTEYKIYKYSNKIKFDQSLNIIKKYPHLEEAIKWRFSDRSFGQGKSNLSLENLGYILKYSCGELWKGVGEYGEFVRRPHPSGGARFPLEYYVYLNKPIENLMETGLYHYNIVDHELELIIKSEEVEIDFNNMFGYEWAKDAPVFIFMTAIFDRTFRKYKEMGYRLCLQESGHVGQNIYLLATSLGVKITSIAGTNNKLIEELLMVDGVQESLVYTMLLG